jgi:hypothetical protein
MSITLIAAALIAASATAAVIKARAPKLVPIRIRVRDRR